PIGCLTSDAFVEEAEMIDTTTRQNNGWETSRPILQRFSVDFSGLAINSKFTGGYLDNVSYDKLVTLKRSRDIQTWKLSTLNEQFIHSFTGYISSLSDAAPSGEFVSFEGTITGIGAPEFSGDLIQILLS